MKKKQACGKDGRWYVVSMGELNSLCRINHGWKGGTDATDATEGSMLRTISFRVWSTASVACKLHLFRSRHRSSNCSLMADADITLRWL